MLADIHDDETPEPDEQTAANDDDERVRKQMANI
jgi:hypothetical protein